MPSSSAAAASRDGVFEACWAALKSGGRLVVNAVTLETERAILGWHAAPWRLAQAHRPFASRTGRLPARLARRDARHAMVGGETMIVAGIGMRAGASWQEIVDLVCARDDGSRLSRGDLHGLATLDSTRARSRASRRRRCISGCRRSPSRRESLRAVAASVRTHSPRVEALHGVGSVAEASALAAAGRRCPPAAAPHRLRARSPAPLPQGGLP